MVEGFAVADHAQFAARALFERGQTHFEISHFGAQLPIALSLLAIRGRLRVDRRLQARNFAQSLIREPEAVLQQDQRQSQYGSENPHGDRSLA